MICVRSNCSLEINTFLSGSINLDGQYIHSVILFKKNKFSVLVEHCFIHNEICLIIQVYEFLGKTKKQNVCTIFSESKIMFWCLRKNSVLRIII